MDAFEVCISCSRHINRVEAACPFCGAPHVARASTAVRRAPRLSRATWLATTLASSLAVAGCTAEVAPSGEPSTENDSGGTSDGKAHQVADSGGKDSGVAEASEEASLADAAEEDATEAEATLDAGTEAEAEAGWHTCYGAPPARLERMQRGTLAA
jgi:hypothetical protein